MTKKLPPTEKLILLFAWFLEGVALLGPVSSFLPAHRLPDLFFYVIAPLVVLLWLARGLAKVLFVPIGVSVCAVLLCRHVSPLTKTITAVLGFVASIAVVRWAATVRF